jgi:hypothetical protein
MSLGLHHWRFCVEEAGQTEARKRLTMRWKGRGRDNLNQCPENSGVAIFEMNEPMRESDAT